MHDVAYGLVPLFDFNSESNLPTLFSSILMLLISLTLFFVGRSHKKQGESYIPWFGLCFIFMFLAVDETASLHERLTQPIKDSLGTTGVLYYAWVIPYGVATIALLVAYSRFLLALPSRYLSLFLTSGALFVSGAVGLELLGGWYDEQHGTYNLTYSILYTVEELFEFTGLSLFLYSLLSYIDDYFGGLTIYMKSE